MSRLSRAGVEPLTVAIGQVIGLRFPLPPVTQQNLSKSIGQLKVISSYGNVLWLGFGIKHIVRTMVESEQGAACAALCGCLSVSYDNSYCAEVLREMTKLPAAPPQFTPSLSQWSAPVNSCSGILLPSEFPRLVEGFSLLWRDPAERRVRTPCQLTEPRNLGKALSILGDVANGTLGNASFVDGADCAWIAAVAEWLLSLRIEIIDSETEQSLYRKFKGEDSQSAHVTIFRGLHQIASILHLQDTTCSVPSGASIVILVPENDVISVFSGGRSTWGSVLGDTFGRRLSDLLSSDAASAFYMMLQFELNDIFDKPTPRIAALQFALSKIPELKGSSLADKDITQLSLESGAATTNYGSIIEEACDHCRSSRHDRSPEIFCFYSMAVCIIKYLRILSYLHLDERIQPSSSGLLQLYLEQNLDPTKDVYLHNPDIFKFVLGIQLGFSTDYVSAHSISGVTICCTLLLDPHLSPREAKTLTVIPGYIEKDGVIYNELQDFESSTRWLAERDHKRPVHLKGICNETSSLKLLVKELFDPHKLEAHYFWEYSQFGQSSRQETYNFSDNPSTSLIDAFEIANLQTNLRLRDFVAQCRRQRVILTQGNNKIPCICSEAQKIVSRETNYTSDIFPQPEERVLWKYSSQIVEVIC